jgi:hypothetical protein
VDYENGVNYVKDIYKSAFGISEKRINKMFKQSSTSKLKFYSWITAIAFLLSCTSFITVVIILCVAY